MNYFSFYNDYRCLKIRRCSRNDTEHCPPRKQSHDGARGKADSWCDWAVHLGGDFAGNAPLFVFLFRTCLFPMVKFHNIFLLPVQKYDTLFERNAKNGSFYLQSKVHRAKECLEAVHQGNSQGTPSWEFYGLTLFPYPWWRSGIWKLCQKEHSSALSLFLEL